MPPVTPLPAFLHADGMQRCTRQTTDAWLEYLSPMDFANNLSEGVVPFAHDPLPEIWKGGRRAEGWRYVFQVDTDKRELRVVRTDKRVQQWPGERTWCSAGMAR